MCCYVAKVNLSFLKDKYIFETPKPEKVKCCIPVNPFVSVYPFNSSTNFLHTWSSCLCLRSVTQRLELCLQHFIQKNTITAVSKFAGLTLIKLHSFT